MIYIHWLFLTIYAIVVTLTIVTILMDNRQSAKTMAWLLVLLFLPMVGIVLYFFFGQNIRKERHISQKSLDELAKRSMLGFAEQDSLHIPSEHSALINLFANQEWALPFKGNKVDIYTNGYDFFPALLRDISQAKHNIHIDTFIIDDDPLGNLVADALIQKAREGITVRLIYDDVGCWRVNRRFFERMREEGIEVHAFMPVKFAAFTSKANYRNHRKIYVIDGRIGFIGGMNIAQRYVKGTATMPWRDTHLRITGPAVYGLQRAFLVDWYFVDRTLITNRVYYPEMAADGNGSLAQIVTSNPTDPHPRIEQGYMHILLNAKKYVYMETPYFLPTEPILFAMRTAALSGVDVRLMVPLKGDSHFVQWASTSYVLKAAEAGVKVMLYKSGFNHSKILISDDAIASCGSVNIDFRSFEHDFESNAFFYDETMAKRLKEVFLQDERKCIDLASIKNLDHRPFLSRLWESLVRLLSPLM